MPNNTADSTNGGANLGFERELWKAADALRNNMDAAEYKHVALGLIFLKYISDAFEAKHAELAAQTAEGADPEDPDEYRAASIFWVPKEARWASNSACFASKASEMYLRKIRPRTTCLYSAASMLLRRASAAAQSFASKLASLVVSVVDFFFAMAQ